MTTKEAARVAEMIHDLSVLRERNCRPRAASIRIDFNHGSTSAFSAEARASFNDWEKRYSDILKALIETEVRELERSIKAELGRFGITITEEAPHE